jgi:orotidine-5'-phosphate decarboxylase
MSFVSRLAQAVHRNNSLLCIGLDPDPALMPPGVSISEFNRSIIDATADLVCAYKPNFAFYEAEGIEGIKALKETIDHIPDDIPVIGDAKRGDIGNTARAYARAIFEYFRCAAVTVSPYLGFDSLEPFLGYQDKEVFILCRTSNAGATDFQSLEFGTGKQARPLFRIVAEKANQWNSNGNIGLVVGASYPDELKTIRNDYPTMPLLIPGIGAQGGDLPTVLRNGIDQGKERTVINSSRQILYASTGNDFAEAARKAANELRALINSHLEGL